MAEPGGGARQREGTLGPAERCGRDGEAFEQPRDPPIMLQLQEHSEALTVLRMRQRMITLVSREIPQIGQCSGDSPSIPELAKIGQTLPIERARQRVVVLLRGQISQMIQARRKPVAVSRLKKKDKLSSYSERARS